MKNDGWATRTLGELTDNFDGQRIPVKEADRRPGSYPYYGASGIVDHVDKYIFDGEYLLIAEDGENLRTCKTPIAFLARGKFWVNNHAHIVHGNEHADTRFLMYALNNGDISGYLTGSTMPKLTQGNMNRIPITAPPPAEQRAIAQVLGALDDKIELNRKMNGTLEAIAKAEFKRMMEEGERKGWPVKKLGDLCEVGRGSSPRPIHEFMGGEIPWIKIADATAAAGPFIFETAEHVTKEGSERSVWVHPGDLILSNSATCGVPVFVDLDGCIHDGWLHFKNLRKLSKHYLFHVLKELSEHLVHIADGSVQKNLNTGLVGGQNVLVPDAESLRRFDIAIVPMFDRIRQNGRESRTLAALRDALLPKLLSGEVRVMEAEKMVEGKT